MTSSKSMAVEKNPYKLLFDKTSEDNKQINSK